MLTMWGDGWVHYQGHSWDRAWGKTLRTTAFPNGKLRYKNKESAIPNYECFFTKKENTLIHSASKVLSYSILTKKYFIPFHFPIPL